VQGSGAPETRRIALDNAGGVYVVGTTYPGSPFTVNLFVAAFTAYGQQTWLTIVTAGPSSAGGSVDGNGITVDSAGNIYVAGDFAGTANFPGFGTLTSTGLHDGFVAKLGRLGNFVWAGAMHGVAGLGASSSGDAITADSLGRIYVTGFFSGPVNLDPTGISSANLYAPPSGSTFLLELFDTGPLTYVDHSPSMGSQTLRLNGTNLDLTDSNTGSLLVRRALAATTNVSISSTAQGGDSLTIDYGGGTFLPPGGIQFNPAAGAANSLKLTGNTIFTFETYTQTGSQAGAIALLWQSFRFGQNLPQFITYTNVSSVYDTASLAFHRLPPYYWPIPPNMTVGVPQANIYLSNGGMAQGYNTTELKTTGALVSMPVLFFANKTDVTINGGAGPKTVTLDDPTPAAGLSSLTVDAGGSGNSIYIASTASGIMTTINAGAGNDLIVVGSSYSAPGSLNGIQGSLTINGAGLSAGDTLRIRDENASASPPPGFTYTIHQDNISRSGAAAIYYSNIQNVELDASQSNNLFNIYDTLAGTSLTIYTGTGWDSTNYPAGMAAVLGQVNIIGQYR
jgi:hypothetical protein